MRKFLSSKRQAAVSAVDQDNEKHVLPSSNNTDTDAAVPLETVAEERNSVPGDDNAVGSNAPVPAGENHKQGTEAQPGGDSEKQELQKGTDGVELKEKDSEVKEEGEEEVDEEDQAGNDADESKYPKALPLWLLTLGLCLSTFVVALDNTIIGKFYPGFSTAELLLKEVLVHGVGYTCTSQLRRQLSSFTSTSHPILFILQIEQS